MKLKKYLFSRELYVMS